MLHNPYLPRQRSIGTGMISFFFLPPLSGGVQQKQTALADLSKLGVVLLAYFRAKSSSRTCGHHHKVVSKRACLGHVGKAQADLILAEALVSEQNVTCSICQRFVALSRTVLSQSVLYWSMRASVAACRADLSRLLGRVAPSC